MTGSLGDILRKRREALGYSLEAAAGATNIRARMLAEIEGGNYSKLPAQGHAAGMVSSYAKFLRLDVNSAVEMFTSEYNAYLGIQEHAGDKSAGRLMRRGTRGSRKGSARGTHNNALQQEQVARNDNRYKSGTVTIVGSRPGSTGRTTGTMRRPTTQLDDPFAPKTSRAATGQGSRSRARSASTRSRNASGRIPNIDHVETGAVTGEASGHITRRAGRTRTASRTSGAHVRSRHSTAGGMRSSQQPTTRGDAPGTEGIVQRVRRTVTGVFAETRTRLIALAVVLLVLAVALAVNFLMSTAGDPNSGVIDVEGGAVNTTETNTDSNKASATITTTNGTPVSVKIEVADGSTSLVNVTYDDDNAYNGMAVGPWSREFQVTESMSATFGNPDAVTVTENGTVVEIERLDDGTGKLTLQIKSKSTISGQD